MSAPYSKLVKHALGKGLLVHTAKFQLTWGEQVYDFTLDAEFFDIRSAKLPALLQDEEDDKLTERLELATRASTITDAVGLQHSQHLIGRRNSLGCGPLCELVDVGSAGWQANGIRPAAHKRRNGNEMVRCMDRSPY